MRQEAFSKSKEGIVSNQDIFAEERKGNVVIMQITSIALSRKFQIHI